MRSTIHLLYYRLPLVLLLVGISSIAAAADNAVVQREFLFETAPFPQCHASTIAETPTGLVAAWFGGTREKDPDVEIWLTRQVDGKWTPPVSVGDGKQTDGTRHPCWNPVLFTTTDGKLLLFYKVGPDPTRWWGMLRTSTDGGNTWNDPKRLPPGILGPIKNKPIQLGQTLLCPTSIEGPGGWRVKFETMLLESGKWSEIESMPDSPGIGAIQPSILKHQDGSLQALGRTKNGKLFTTSSSDNGLTWSPLTLTDLPNPNSGTDAVTLADGRHLLIYNHTAKGRTPLNLAFSTDGKSWQAAEVLEKEPGEYSYPAIIQTKDGRVHATYTWKRQRVRHVVIDPTELTGKPIVNSAWPE